MHRLSSFLVVFSCLVLLAGCAGVKGEASYPDRRRGMEEPVYNNQRETIFGKGGLSLFGRKKEEAASGNNIGITVNAYLWRAALDSLSFMPLASTDPFGGTILTDWYEAPQAQGERIKANVLILSRTLRSDALKVSLFRQVKDKKGQWQDAAVDPATVTQLENAILTKARGMRVAEQAKK